MNKNLLLFISQLVIVLIVISCWRVNETKEEKFITDQEAITLMHSFYDTANRVVPEVPMPMARGKTVNFYHVGSTYNRDRFNDTSTVYGMAFETVVTKLRIGGDKIKSNWMSMFYEYTNENGQYQRDWVQWGYMVHGDWGLAPAFFVYHISGAIGYSIAGNLQINYYPTSKPLIYGEKTRFEMRNKPGTTWWVFSRGGVDIMEVNLHAESAQGSFSVMTESWGGDNFAPQIKVEYVDYLIGSPYGSWKNIPHSEIQQPRVWECKGSLQDNSLQTSAMLIGGRADESISYYQLW